MGRFQGPIILLWAMAAPPGATADAEWLGKECDRVTQVYPTLMLAVMMEGDVNCGDPDSGEYVSCYEGETAEQKAARERRLAIRQHQEAAYKNANAACRAWEADRRSAAHDGTLKAAIGTARASDGWRPEQEK